MNLNQLLSDPDISVPELFQQPDILNHIKNKIPLFVDFCKRNQDFTKKMIARGVKTPMHQIENAQMRKVAHVASDILTCDNDALAELFIIQQAPSRIRCYSQSQDEVLQQIASNQTTGELVFTDRTPSKQNKYQDEFSKKYIFLLDLLSYIQQKQPDQNCLNYMMKVLNTVIRVKPQQLFQFFQEKPEILKRLIQLTNYPSVSYSIVKFLNESQDKKYRSFKIQVVNMIIKQIIGKVSASNFQVYAEFIEQVFDKNRHRSQQQDQIKIITQPLVNKQVINSMLTGVLESKQSRQVGNSLIYLLKVGQRMNIDEQQDPYSYNTQAQNKPTMDFQVDQIYNKFNELIDLAPTITRQKYQTWQVLTYYDFILAMTNNSRFKNLSASIKKYKAIISLLKALNANQSKFNGIIKNKIITLIQKFNSLPSTNQQKPAAENQGVTTTSSSVGLQLEQIRRQVQRMQQSSHQGRCYKQKLSLLFIDPEQIQKSQKVIQIYNKYSSLLAPTTYTQNRSLKIKEFQFLKQHKDRIYTIISKNKESKKEKDNASTNNGSTINSESKQSDKEYDAFNGRQMVIEEDDTESKNKQKQGKKVGANINAFNVDMLNNKINAIKTKKQQQKAQQENKKSSQQVNQKQIIVEKDKNGIQETESPINKQQKQIIIDKQENDQAPGTNSAQQIKQGQVVEKQNVKQKQKKKQKQHKQGQQKQKQKQKGRAVNGANMSSCSNQKNSLGAKQNKQQKLVPYYVKYLILF